jgi:hypothetical protein
MERMFLDLVLIIPFFSVAIENGPDQPLRDNCAFDIITMCNPEPALGVLLKICHLSVDAIHKLSSLFLGV